MKFALLLLLPFLAFAKDKAPKADIFNVVANESLASWIGKKVTGQHNGTINIKGGTLQFAKGALTGGSVDIDMASIVNKDIDDKEMNAKLIGHLKSDDFFAADRFPVATLQITKAEKQTANTYSITGNLTIKGIKNAVTFPATVMEEKGTVKAVAKLDLDRTKWDIKYKSANFFKNLGDKAIHDVFTVDVNLVAKK